MSPWLWGALAIVVVFVVGLTACAICGFDSFLSDDDDEFDLMERHRELRKNAEDTFAFVVVICAVFFIGFGH